MALLKMIGQGVRRPAALRKLAAWLVGLVLLCSVRPSLAADTKPSAEYQVEAVFLFNFAQFVEWPARAFKDPQAPLVIGVLGEDPFGAYLDEVVSGEKVANRPLMVRRYKRAEDITECHILFISRSEAATLDKTIAQLTGKSILTVSDLDTFSRQGGMVRFVTENGKIRLRISKEFAESCGLTISSKVLRFATIVTAGKD